MADGGSVALRATTADLPAKRAPAATRRQGLRWALFLLLPLALAAGAYLYATGGRYIVSDDSYVEADKVALSTDVSGLVKEIDVHDNQKVTAGDVLFRLDDEQYRIALQRAEAQLGTVRNTINAMKASYRDMQAQQRQAQADIDYYSREFQRQQDLVGRQVTSQSSFDAARHNLQVSQQKLASLTQQLAAITANLDGDPDVAVEKHPQYLAALAQRDEAARQLAHTVIKAPFDGIVTNVPALQPGQYLQASTASFSLVAGDHVWIAAQPKETELTHVQPGQAVTVTVDTYPGLEWHGTVESLSPASGSEFSLLPAQNTSGNWVKVVQRIPVRVRIETPAGMPQLRAGMSVEIEIDTGHARGLPHILAGLFGSARGG